MDQFYTPFYANKMRKNKYLHIIWFPHFTDNRNGVEKMEENYDSLWKIQTVFEILNRYFQNFTTP